MCGQSEIKSSNILLMKLFNTFAAATSLVLLTAAIHNMGLYEQSQGLLIFFLQIPLG